MAQAVKLTDTIIAKAALAPSQKQTILWDSVITGRGVEDELNARWHDADLHEQLE